LFQNVSDDDYCPSRNNFNGKDMDFGFYDECQPQQSFPVSPFMASNRNAKIEKKLSQLMNPCLTPKKGHPLNGSMTNQQTPVNPLNKYLDFKDQEPSPFGNSKFESGKNPFFASMKSNFNTPEIPHGRGLQNEDVFQRFVLPKMEDSLRKLISSSKKKKKSNRHKSNMRHPANSHFAKYHKESKAPLLEDFNAVFYKSTTKEDDMFFKQHGNNLSFENPLYQDNERHQPMNRMAMKIEQDAKHVASIMAKKEYFRQERPFNKRKNDNIRNNNIIGFRRTDRIEPFYDLSKQSHLSSQVYNFLESSYSKIMESGTPRNPNQNQFGKLFATAINNIKDDKQVKDKPAPKNKILSDMQSFNQGPSGFPEGTIQITF
jgi:hypothetical protein